MTDAPVPDGPAGLTAAVVEIENHLARAGWDQPARLYALVDTAALLDHSPDLAEALGVEGDPEPGSLTAVEQESLAPGTEVEDLLQTIAWPPHVDGCAVAVERLVLPPDVDADIPEDPAEAASFAASHPLRQDVRIVAGATRDGSVWCALRLRAHDEDSSVLTGADLVPQLTDLLQSTLTEEPIEP